MRIPILLSLVLAASACGSLFNPGKGGDIDVIDTPKPNEPVVLEWTTVDPTTGVVELGTSTGDYYMYAYEPGAKFRTNHRVSLFGLQEGRKYYYRLRSIRRPLGRRLFEFLAPSGL